MTPDLFAVPKPGGSIIAASGWIEQMLRGELATAVSVTAIAIIGLAMLSGRLPTSRALRVVLGCFILFGSPAIALGLLASARGTDEAQRLPDRSVHSPPPPLLRPPAETTANPFDPYAGSHRPN